MAGLRHILVKNFDWGEDVHVPEAQKQAVSLVPVYHPSRDPLKQIEAFKEWSAKLRFVMALNGPKPKVRQVKHG